MYNENTLLGKQNYKKNVDNNIYFYYGCMVHSQLIHTVR